MAHGQRRRRAPCPGCDSKLPALDLAAGVATCPECAQPLLPMRVAGLWRRSVATIADTLLLLSTAGFLTYGLYRLAPGAALAPGARGIDALLLIAERDLIEILAPLIPFVAMAGVYFVLFHAIAGRTPGQRLLSLRVINRHGGRPSPMRAAIRVIVAGLSSIPGGLGPLWMAFDLEARAIHDHLAGTYVVMES